jgi:hypothetical protein
MAEADHKKAITSTQGQAKLIFPAMSSIKANFLNACVKWAVDDYQPLYVGECKSFKAMIYTATQKLLHQMQRL